MSGKLDQALDDITSAQRRNTRRVRPQRRAAGRPVASAPVGGIQKNPRPVRGAGNKAAPTKAIPANSDSKIIVSNLPKDVTEQQIKEYFVTSVGPIKRVELSYGPNSQSRGIANVTFSKSDGASKAFQKLNGLLVDNRPIKIEIVVGAAQVEKVIPQPKTLAERTTQPKPQPKSAAADKHNGVNGAKGGIARGLNKKRRGRNARPAKKTAEELDLEMEDYYNAAGANSEPAASAPPAPANGDAAMEDQIL